ncbi:hypothetical protein FN846DRAFT_935238 [Sphaerosporella brunnea]|uniref:Uncharacterized protein n=1 Tax=Sphaerosporella brunnea TaxID=1250544 RepID=A0A5J5F5S3_9PEZI|nr:hypothetical protein FN846DRAFT_935238 [Sphaerosporella brunnea]
MSHCGSQHQFAIDKAAFLPIPITKADLANPNLHRPTQFNHAATTSHQPTNGIMSTPTDPAQTAVPHDANTNIAASDDDDANDLEASDPEATPPPSPSASSSSDSGSDRDSESDCDSDTDIPQAEEVKSNFRRHMERLTEVPSLDCLSTSDLLYWRGLCDQDPQLSARLQRYVTSELKPYHMDPDDWWYWKQFGDRMDMQEKMGMEVATEALEAPKTPPIREAVKEVFGAQLQALARFKDDAEAF